MPLAAAVLQYIYIFVPYPAQVFLQGLGLLQGANAPEIAGEFLVRKIKMNGTVAGLA